MNLTITIDVEQLMEDAEQTPQGTDPHEIAENVLYEYNEWARANGEQQVVFVGAEWA